MTTKSLLYEGCDGTQLARLTPSFEGTDYVEFQGTRDEDTCSKSKGKAVPLQALRGPKGSSKLRFQNFIPRAQGGGRLSALRTGRFYP